MNKQRKVKEKYTPGSKVLTVFFIALCLKRPDLLIIGMTLVIEEGFSADPIFLCLHFILLASRFKRCFTLFQFILERGDAIAQFFCLIHLLLSSKQLFYHHLGIKYFQIIRNALSICHIRQICP